MQTLPNDPLSPSQSYSYTSADSDDYVLSACLENASDANGVDKGDCSSGKAFEIKP
jgi:hypothetical protein